MNLEQGKFNPGFEPVEYRCLVLPDDTETKVGNIIIPEPVLDREKHAQVKGTLVSVGAKAFEDWGDDRAALKPGTRVIYAKYCGVEIKGEDDRTYRLITDKDIGARIYE